MHAVTQQNNGKYAMEGSSVCFSQFQLSNPISLNFLIDCIQCGKILQGKTSVTNVQFMAKLRCIFA